MTSNANLIINVAYKGFVLRLLQPTYTFSTTPSTALNPFMHILEAGVRPLLRFPWEGKIFLQISLFLVIG